jgi:hypothetical protein
LHASLLAPGSARVASDGRIVADPIAPVVVELAIAFGDCDSPADGALSSGITRTQQRAASATAS